MKTKSDMYQISILPYDADDESYPVARVVSLPEGKGGPQKTLENEWINVKSREQFAKDLGELLINNSAILKEYFSD